MDETPLEGKEGTLESEPLWIYKWRCKVDRDIRLHQEVLDKGYPNRWGVRIPIQSKWNLDRFEQLLEDYGDWEVVEWMRYGWPTHRLPTLTDPDKMGRNHKGASDFPEALKKYIVKESSKGAIMGPFDEVPFQSKVGHITTQYQTKKRTQRKGE